MKNFNDYKSVDTNSVNLKNGLEISFKYLYQLEGNPEVRDQHFEEKTHTINISSQDIGDEKFNKIWAYIIKMREILNKNQESNKEKVLRIRMHNYDNLISSIYHFKDQMKILCPEIKLMSDENIILTEMKKIDYITYKNNKKTTQKYTIESLVSQQENFNNEMLKEFKNRVFKSLKQNLIKEPTTEQIKEILLEEKMFDKFVISKYDWENVKLLKEEYIKEVSSNTIVKEEKEKTYDNNFEF